MILIGGTSLKVDELPMSEIMDYQIESGKPLEIKLKTIAKKPECFAIYLHEEQRSELTIVDEIVEKLVYYKDDKDLISYLMGDRDDNTYVEEDLGTVAPEFGPPKTDKKDELSDFESDDIFSDSHISNNEETFETADDIFGSSDDTFESAEDIFQEVEEVIEEVIEEVVEEVVEEVLEEVEEEVAEEVAEEEAEEVAEEVVEEVVEEVEEVEEIVEEEQVEIEEIDKVDTEDKPYYENMEDVDTELPDSFLQIPNLGDDTDSLKLQLESKDRLIKQKEGMIRELEEDRDDVYKLQEIQIKEIQDVYNKKMEEVNSIIATMEKKDNAPEVEEDALNFLKFFNYSKNFRASLKEGFTDSEKMKLGRLHSNYYIFSSGSGDSLYSMLRNVKNFIEKNNNAIVIDFTNDPFLSTAFAKSIKTINGTKTYSMDLIQEDANLLEMFTSFSKTKVLFSTLYNDIGLLSMDWVDILKKVDEYAGGKPVIFMFNNINSFSVRYTISKLATIGKLYVFAKCSPLILTTLFGDIKFIPADRVNIVALEYIDVVKNVLNVIADKYQVLTFVKEVDWNKLIK